MRIFRQGGKLGRPAKYGYRERRCEGEGDGGMAVWSTGGGEMPNSVRQQGFIEEIMGMARSWGDEPCIGRAKKLKWKLHPPRPSPPRKGSIPIISS
jgi:hypothetical protein